MSQQVKTLGTLLETHRVNLNLLINVTEDYSDFSPTPVIDFDCKDLATATLYPDNSPTRYPFNAPIHYDAPELALQWFGARCIYRHGARADGFTRAPYCANNESWFNGNLLNNSTCVDWTLPPIPPLPPEPFVTRIVTEAHLNQQTMGLYQKAESDFFFEVSHQTTDPFYSGGSHIALARRERINGLDVLPLDYYSTAPSLNLTNIAVPDDIDLLIIPTSNDPCPVPHYLCINNPDRRATLINRMKRLAATKADFVLIDEWIMPHAYDNSFQKRLEGCWCEACRDFYCYDPLSPNQSSDPDCIPEFVEQASPINPISIVKRRRMTDHLNASTFQHLLALRTEVNVGASTLVHSVSDFPSLMNDNVRSNLIGAIDYAKTEWTIPIKQAHNRIFWCSNETSTNDICNSKYKILYNHRIPTYLRLSVALGIARDASPTRLLFTWTPNDPFNPGPETDIDFQLGNRRFLHTMGFAYVIGTQLSVTAGRTILPSSDFTGAGPFTIFDRARFLTNNATLPAGSENVLAENNHRVFDIDNNIAPIFREKRPLVWASVYFSERERNIWLYLPGIANYTPNLLLDSNGASFINQNNQHLEAQREAAAWMENLLPMHAAAEALMNSPLTNDPNEPISIKMPVTFTNDSQIDAQAAYNPEFILVPAQRDIPTSFVLNGNMNTATPQFNLTTATNNALTTLGKHVVGVGNAQGHWYQNDPPNGFNHVDGLIEIRQTILGNSNLPPVYAVGHTLNARPVIAGFLSDPNALVSTTPDLVVVLSNNPVWGLQNGWLEMQNNTNSLLPPNTLPAVFSPLVSGEISIHIPDNSQFVPSSPACALVAQAIGYDGVTQPLAVSYQNVPLLQPQLAGNVGEFIIEAPAFDHFAVVHITSVCP